VGPRPLAIGGPHDATGFCGQRQEHGIQRISAGQGPATGELELASSHEHDTADDGDVRERPRPGTHPPPHAAGLGFDRDQRKLVVFGLRSRGQTSALIG
jgi:hypothetical protein